MARCLNCIHYDVCDTDRCEKERLYGQCSDFLHDDDVSKSEVDRLVDKWIGEEKLTQDEKTLRLIEALRDEAKRYERYYFNHEYDKLIARAKEEVFEEIDNITDLFAKGLIGELEMYDKIAELKKAIHRK